MAEPIDLTPFCSVDQNRPHLWKPHSRGDWTFATNGHIAVRLPRREDIAADPDAPDVAKVFDKAIGVPERALPVLDFTAIGEPCYRCDENPGWEHDCPACTCLCKLCRGSLVTVDHASVDLGGTPFAANYIRLLSALPGLIVPVYPDARGAMPFAFDDGSGVLMPLASKREIHVPDPGAAK